MARSEAWSENEVKAVKEIWPHGQKNTSQLSFQTN